MGTGVNISKEVTYVVLAPPIGVSVGKELAYVVLAPPIGVSVAKEVTYAVLWPGNVNPPVWGSITPPDGTVAIAYDWTFDMPAAAQVVAHSVTVGSLPPGLTLTALTGNRAHIHGTPTLAGAYSSTLHAVNTYGAADLEVTITINDTPIPPASGGGNWGWIA